MAYIKNLIVTAVMMLSISAIAIAANSSKSTELDPQANALLKRMSDYMAGLKSFTADGFVFDEQIMSDGFKLSVLGAGSLKVQRPNKFFIAYKESGQGWEVFFDGNRIVVFDRGNNVYIQVPKTSGMDASEWFDAFAETLGAELPASDLLGTDAYSKLIEPVEESSYLDAVEIGGLTCRHLAFRTDEVDWQIWIEEGKRPLPCRYTITSRWVYAAPQHTVTFTNWRTNPKIPAKDFNFTASGAKSMTVEEFRKLHKQTGGE